MSFDFSQTYLYKIHRLTNSLDTIFDTTLRKHAGISLSQFTLLLSVNQHQPTTQRHVATFLGVSPGAISRQVEIANKNKWISIQTPPDNRRSHTLYITAQGEAMIATGIAALEKRVFHIFDDENIQTNLMRHIERLQKNIDCL